MAAKNFDLSLIVRALDRASPVLKAIGARIQKTFGESKTPVKDFGNALAGVGSAAWDVGTRVAGVAAGAAVAFGAIMKGAMDAGDKLGEMAQRVGLSVDAYASLQHAAAQADVEQETFNTAMDKFNKNMGEMTVGKGGAFLEFLNKISPTFAKQMKAAKGTEAGLALMTDALAKIEDPGKRAALAAAAFGKSGLAMGQFLGQGSAKIQEAQRRYMDLVGSQERFVEGAGALDNATRETEVAFLGLRNAIFTGLAPAMVLISEKVTDFLAKNREGIAAWADRSGAAIQKWIDSGGFDRLMTRIDDTVTSINKFIDAVGPTNLAIGAGVLAMSPLISATATLGSSLIGLAIKILPVLAAAFTAAWPAIAAFGTATWAALAPLLPFIAAAAGLGVGLIVLAENWDKLTWIIADWANTMKFAVLDAWEAVRPVFEKIAAAWAFIRGGGDTTVSMTGEGARPSLGAAGVPGPTSSQPAAPATAQVSIDFSNLPPGARVSTQPNSSQPVDLSLGYSMVRP